MGLGEEVVGVQGEDGDLESPLGDHAHEHHARGPPETTRHGDVLAVALGGLGENLLRRRVVERVAGGVVNNGGLVDGHVVSGFLDIKKAPAHLRGGQ